MIARQVKTLFAAYRRDDFADPEGFVVQLGTVLEAYPEDVIVEITSPRTGLQRRCKFPPSIAEVVEACNSALESKQRLERYRSLKLTQYHRAVPQVRQHGERAQIFIRQGYPRYAEMVERAQRSDADPLDWKHGELNGKSGIWVAARWLEGSVKAGKWKQVFTPEAIQEKLSIAPEQWDALPDLKVK